MSGRIKSLYFWSERYVVNSAFFAISAQARIENLLSFNELAPLDG